MKQKPFSKSEIKRFGLLTKKLEDAFGTGTEIGKSVEGTAFDGSAHCAYPISVETALRIIEDGSFGYAQNQDSIQLLRGSDSIRLGIKTFKIRRARFSRPVFASVLTILCSESQFVLGWFTSNSLFDVVNVFAECPRDAVNQSTLYQDIKTALAESP